MKMLTLAGVALGVAAGGAAGRGADARRLDGEHGGVGVGWDVSESESESKVILVRDARDSLLALIDEHDTRPCVMNAAVCYTCAWTDLRKE